ncbi:MAG: hypothetical protein CMM07_07255 [Rhodopirellula sp.]|nr:hypothetical protein [Rhodopirellula sp.]
MPSQTMLHRVAKHKGSHARHLLKFVHSLAEIFFLKMIQVKRVKLFENSLQVTLQPASSDQRFGQPRKNLSQLCDGGNTHLVPVIKLLLTLSHALVS